MPDTTRYIIITQENKIFEYEATMVKEVLNFYIEDVLKFNERFNISSKAWVILSELDKPDEVRIELVNSLCKKVTDKIKCVINGSFIYSNKPLLTGVKYNSVLINGELVQAVVGFTGRYSEVVVLAELDNISVVKINDNAFANQADIISIQLPDTIQTIGANAFENCKSLTEIDMPATITSIGIHAFKGCSNLSRIEIPDGITKILPEHNWFTGCDNLESVVIPTSVTDLYLDAFTECKNFKKIEYKGTFAQWQDMLIFGSGDAAAKFELWCDGKKV